MELASNSEAVKYRYLALHDPSTDIRLIKLLPGRPNEKIQLQILHSPISKSKEARNNGSSAPQLQSALPKSWKAHKTVEGRCIFENDGSWHWGGPPDFVHPCCVDMSSQSFQPEYEALSYTWGAIEEQVISVIDDPAVVGHQSPQYAELRVRKSLYDALLSLRNANDPRILWVDSICLNQEDSNELAIQIPRMRQIYSCAMRVIAWIGPECESSSQALRNMDYIGQQVELLKEGHVCASPDAVEVGWDDPSTILYHDDQTWEAIYSLLHRHWFDRVWTVQEILLANSHAVIQCGDDQIPFKRFRAACTCLKENHRRPSRLEARLRYLAKIANPSRGLAFHRVLLLTYQRRCANPRDYVYGVLGLAPERIVAKIHPDYSLSVAQVYTEVTMTYLEHVQRLELITRTYQHGRLIDTPSWVPDLTAWMAREFPCGGQFAAGYSRAHWVYTEPDVLKLLGAKAATITHVSTPLFTTDKDPMAIVRYWGPNDMSSREALQDSHLKTLRMGRVYERWIAWNTIYPRFKHWSTRWLDYVLAHEEPRDNDLISSLGADHHIRQTIEFCKGHAYIQTKEGYVGLAPPDTQPDDIVCVFLGCDEPVILRKKENGTFIVIGECYVHDLMDVTGILGPLPSPWEVQMFRNHGNRYKYRFHNKKTNELSDDDPRLGPLDKWRRIDMPPEPDDPIVYAYFQHVETGEVINSDPRMLPDALEAEGVKLEWFNLT